MTELKIKVGASLIQVIYYFFYVCAAFWNQLDKTTAAHVRRRISFSGELGGKLLLPCNLTCQFTCPLPPPSLPSFLPPATPEASQTQMFYTAYEMFEGHRKRKSAWAWFPLCRAP